MSNPRILVVSSCTGEKRFKPENQLKLADFQNSGQLKSRSQDLDQYACPAIDMYRGAQHLRVKEGLALLRQTLGDNTVDLAIISAGYGLIDENTRICPYEVTFNGMNATQVIQWANFLKIHQSLETKVSNYELIFILLGEKYLKALQLPIITRQEQTLFFLAPRSQVNSLQGLKAQSFVLPLSNREAKYYGYGAVGLKGYLFKRFAEVISRKPELLSKFIDNPECFPDLITSSPLQLKLTLSQKSLEAPSVIKVQVIKLQNFATTNLKSNRSEIGEIIAIPTDLAPAPNFDLGMQYFIPEWDDYVDPKYDFIRDSLSPNRQPQVDDVYAHEMFSQLNYDGILMSRTVFDKSPIKRAKLLADGIHKYIRFPGKILGDCGAFGYIKEDEPPYQTQDILKYYQQIGVDYGVSIDHLIVGGFATVGIREKRYDLTIKNAQDFLDKYKKGNYNFEPIGAVQGWSPESYADAVSKYINMGYKYIAIGGLAREKNDIIINILKAIYPELKSDIKLHLFGVGRLNLIPIFRHLGVTSFDSASPLRKAWLDPEANYHCITGDIYAAVRIPNIDRYNVRIKRIIDHNIADRKTLKRLEQKALDSMRKFDKNELDLSDTLDALLEYDQLLELPRDGKVDQGKTQRRVAKHGKLYQRLLEDKPWQKCDCPICQDLGVEVVIFRGNDRNRRRGFHNTYIFYKRFQEMLTQ
jgi:hypothetical protein